MGRGPSAPAHRGARCEKKGFLTEHCSCAGHATSPPWGGSIRSSCQSLSVKCAGAGPGECRDEFDLSDVCVCVSLFSQMFARDTVTRLWQMGAVLTSCLSP